MDILNTIAQYVMYGLALLGIVCLMDRVDKWVNRRD